jgi:hypothetical protein
MTPYNKSSINPLSPMRKRMPHPTSVRDLSDYYSLKTQIIKKRREHLLFSMDSLNFA